jgi:hypothetical protein
MAHYRQETSVLLSVSRRFILAYLSEYSCIFSIRWLIPPQPRSQVSVGGTTKLQPLAFRRFLVFTPTSSRARRAVRKRSVSTAGVPVMTALE